MREYLLPRLFLLIPTLLSVTFIVFLMMRFIPGDPITNMMGETYSAADAQQLRHEFGLDQPLVVQYGKWLVLMRQPQAAGYDCDEAMMRVPGKAGSARRHA